MANGSRRQGREAALQVVYMVDLCKQSVTDVTAAAWSEEPLTEKIRQFAQHLAQGVVERQAEIDQLLKKYTENWELSRMAAIDRSILRIAAFEILQDLETPINVIINEAVEVAKKYSTSESGRFVNGILDKLKLERKS
ncbi:MAG: transcription antitermination factor NusB [Elusimicrobiota bacterium]|jgi:N utilization substance protein B